MANAPNKKQPQSHKQALRQIDGLAAWREARVQHYVQTRSPDALARMVVELEDSGDNLPEFEIDDEWPEMVRHMRAK